MFSDGLVCETKLNEWHLIAASIGLGVLSSSVAPFAAHAQSASACVELGSPRVEYAEGSETISGGKTISSAVRNCLPTPNTGVTSLTLGNSTITSSGLVEL